MNKKEIVKTGVIVLLIMFVIIGTTYAIYTWAVNEVIMGGTECFNINYVKGQDIGSENGNRTLMVSSDYTEGLYASVIVSMDSNCVSSGIGTLYLNTDDTTSDILLTSGVLKYQIIENSLTLGESGTISSSGELAILENIEITTSPNQFTVVVWLDASLVNNDNVNQILSSSYKGNISMKVEGNGDI